VVTTVRDLSYEEIAEGVDHVHDYAITPAVYGSFLEAFDDRSPIHVDKAYARERGFEGVVMHGAMLNGFVSHFIGVRFPGRRALLLSVDLRYGSPSYLGDTVRIRATVAQKVDAQKVIVLKLQIENLTRGTTAATGRAQVKVADA
jgi:3-hydroxybutyryl-CoA dehydratase